MPMNFPDPVEGAVFTDPTTGAQYTYKNGVWMQVSAAQITLPPAGPINSIIVNGDFQVSAENGRASGGPGYYMADAWVLGATYSTGPGGQSAWDASLGAFKLAFQNGSAATPTGSQLIMASQYIEGIRLNALKWGTALAIPAVLNFKAIATVPGVYSVAVRDQPGAYSFVRDLALTAAWQEFTIPVPAQTAGTWNIDSFTTGGTLAFVHSSGPTFKGGVSGQWNTGNFLATTALGNNGAAGISNMQVREVRLVPDPQNTKALPPYQPQHYGAAVQECERLWQADLASGTAIVASIATGAGQAAYAYFPFRTLMRATPAIAIPAITYGNASGMSPSAVGGAGVRVSIAGTTSGNFYATFNWVANARNT